MNPTFETSVLAFPHIEQRSARPSVTAAEVEEAVKLAADDIRLNWLRTHATSHKVCGRTRLINAAMVSDLSDNAFRVLCLQLSFTNGYTLETNVGNDTIAVLAKCNEKTVRRSNKELEAGGWVTAKRRRRDGADKVMAIPGAVLAQIGSEIMANIPPHLVAGTAVSAGQDRTKMSTQGSYGKFQDRTKMSDQEIVSGYNSDQDRTEMSTQGDYGKFQDRTKMSGQEIISGYNGNNTRIEPDDFNLRPDKNVHLICIKEKTTRGGDCIQSTGDCIQSGVTPPKVENTSSHVTKVASAILAGLASAPAAATTPAEPPAIVQPAAPDVAECWRTPKARYDAGMRPAEARAQRELCLTDDGRLEASGGFRAELETTFPLVPLLIGLTASAPNVKSDMTAILAQQTIRRQFAYMQADAQRRADRDAAIAAKFSNNGKPKTERVPVYVDENGKAWYSGT